MDLMEKALMEHMCKDINGTNFYVLYHRGGKDVRNLVDEIKKVISEHDLTVSETMGLLEFMKFSIAFTSYLPKQK